MESVIENPKVRAKFKLSGVRKYIANQWDDFTKSGHEMPVADLEFNAVGRDPTSTENTAFWKSTPSGTIKVTVVNQDAVGILLDHLGGDFYVDFTWVPGSKPSTVSKISTKTETTTRYDNGREAKYESHGEEERAY